MIVKTAFFALGMSFLTLVGITSCSTDRLENGEILIEPFVPILDHTPNELIELGFVYDNGGHGTLTYEKGRETYKYSVQGANLDDPNLLADAKCEIDLPSKYDQVKLEKIISESDGFLISPLIASEQGDIVFVEHKYSHMIFSCYTKKEDNDWKLVIPYYRPITNHSTIKEMKTTLGR